MRRVVVTGMAGISPIGSSWEQVASNLRQVNTGVRYMESWDKYDGLNTRLGAPVSDFSVPAHYNRKATRGMGRIALMATRSAELALENAGLLDDPSIQDGRMGISFGSSAGSLDAIKDFASMLINGNTDAMNSTSYIRMMSHTAPVNIGVFFGLRGRIVTTSSACTSGSQGIGYAYETIKYGKQVLMIAGGAEELCATEAAVFDTLYATSTRNSTPHQSPRPFDVDRDGLVIGEGAGCLILEEMEHAKARGATIYAEILGFGTNSDGAHVTQPESGTMQVAMQMALDDARLEAAAIGYVSAHGTATSHGDVAESHATAKVFGPDIPISALKSYTGHTLGACGALEAWVAINMMNEDWFHPTANLKSIDPKCAELNYITNEARTLNCEYVMSNNFAFGGINTSLVFKRWK